MITLDASVVIAHLSSDDPRHDIASAYLSDAADELIMHPLNLAEVLVGGVKAGVGQELLADLHTLGIRAADRDDGEPLRLAELRVRSGLKLPDCCALDTAQITRSTLATFDAALARSARALALIVQPETNRH